MIGLIFTTVLTLAGLLYGWLNPIFGLMVYYCFAVLRPPSLWKWSVGQTGSRYMYLVALSVLVGWGLKGFGTFSRLKHVKWPIIGLGLYLFAGLIGSEFIAIDKAVAWKEYQNQLKIGLIVLVAMTLLTDVKSIKLFAWVVTLSFGYLAFNLNQQYLKYPMDLVLNGFGGIDNNGAAMIMVLGVPLTLFMGLQAKYWWLKGISFFFTLCLIHVVLFSYSRGAELGLIMVGLMTFIAILIALPRKGLTLALGIFMVWFTLTMAGPGVRHEFMSIFADKQERDASAESRFYTWSAGWRCMKDHPLGVGPRNFNLVANQYGLSRGKSIHNLYLQTGADYGFAGAIGLILFYFGSAWQAFSMSLSPTARRLGWPRHYGQMCAIALAGFAVCSTFIGMETVEHGFIVATVSMVTVGYVRNLAAQEEAHGQEPIPELQQVPSPDTGELPQLGQFA